MRIGELAARSGRSAHTIRWYDSQRLIPGIVRDPAGQRRFNTRHVEWLALVERLRNTGMSIAQIRAYAKLVQQDPPDISMQRDLLFEHRTRVAETIAAWKDALALIDSKVAFYDRWMETGERPGAKAKGAVLEAAAKSKLSVRKGRAQTKRPK